jgi:hypothetical protein
MNQKSKNWSEARGQYDDIIHGLGGEDIDEVDSRAVRRGVILLSDCNQCGRQWKGIIPWGEVAMFFMGEPVHGTKATRQGIYMMLGCQCNKSFPMIIDWDEVRRWVDMGIRSGSINPQILRARR